MNLSPIVLFVYNRIKNTKSVIKALKKNLLSEHSILYIYSDGGKSESDYDKIEELRKFLNTVSGFKEVVLIFREKNYGLKKNIIEGVSDVISKHGKVIVLEDDLITSSNFLNFMNAALDYYANNDRVHSISGYTMPLKSLNSCEKDFYFGLRASSWGWATWDRIWDRVDWTVRDYDSFSSSKKLRKSFNKGGKDMVNMLKNNVLGKIDSWAIVFCYDQWKNNRVTIFPSKSKVVNFGFSESATNTKNNIPEYKAIIDQSDKRNFNFDSEILLEPKLLSEFSFKFSYVIRIKNKLLNIFRS